MASGGLSVYTEVTPGRFALQKTDPRAVQIAKALRWYTPRFSPHDVPAFYDIGGLTEDPLAMRACVELLVERYRPHVGQPGGPTHIAGFEARGFLIGTPLALALGLPFVMIRKVGKLPGVLVRVSYTKEYGSDDTTMRLGAVRPGDRVVLVDDLIATGGTALAGYELVHACGAAVHEFAAVVALDSLGGIQKIQGHGGGKFAHVPILTVVTGDMIGSEQCADPKVDAPRTVSPEQAPEWLGKLDAAK
eukprot:RCo035063